MKVLSVILFSSFKFAMTFPLAILEFNMGILMTILWTNIGGLIGILVFSFLSEKIIHFWNKHALNHLNSLFRYEKKIHERKRFFTKKNRRIIKIKSKFGLFGIAFATPLILSIPLGSFLIVRYFGKSLRMLSVLAAANMFWSIFYAFFYTFFYEICLQLVSGI